MPGMKSVLQVYKKAKGLTELKTYTLDHTGGVETQKQFYHQIRTFTTLFVEINYGLSFEKKSEDSVFESYIDDSLKLVQRPILDPTSTLKRKDSSELDGYYTFPSVNGGLLKEIQDLENGDKKQTSISWLNSNSLGATLTGPKEVNFILFRNSKNNDFKGVPGTLQDPHTTSISFIFRV